MSAAPASSDQTPEVCSPAAWCETMRENLAPLANAQAKGLVRVVVHNLQGKARTLGIAYKKHAQDRGLMLDFCPWCGMAIDWGFAQPSQDAKGVPDVA